MPRPQKTRWIYGSFDAQYFKPRGQGISELEEVALEADELEALRLADLEELYQNDAAEKMGVSRQTFGNILKRARKKVADALIGAKAIRMNPPAGMRQHCHLCGREWTGTAGIPDVDECPECLDDRRLHPGRYGRGRHRR
jgi:uncharacterized protein